MMYDSLLEGQSLGNGELQSFYEEVAKLVLQELLAVEEAQPQDIVQYVMVDQSLCTHCVLFSVSLSKSGKELESFLSNLQDGEYDSPTSKAKVIYKCMNNYKCKYI